MGRQRSVGLAAAVVALEQASESFRGGTAGVHFLVRDRETGLWDSQGIEVAFYRAADALRIALGADPGSLDVACLERLLRLLPTAQAAADSVRERSPASGGDYDDVPSLVHQALEGLVRDLSAALITLEAQQRYPLCEVGHAVLVAPFTLRSRGTGVGHPVWYWLHEHGLASFLRPPLVAFVPPSPAPARPRRAAASRPSPFDECR